MPIFRKAILSSGKYMASKAGQRCTAEFPESRLRRMAATANDMIQAGLKIPGPFDHTPKAIPVTDFNTNTFNNGGFWRKFWVEMKNNVPTLFGEIDAPGDVNDINSPAGKLGKTVQECSVSVRDEFTDGQGRVWNEDPIMHVALCCHPVDFSQPNFELLADECVLSMSCLLSTQYDASDISLLREKLKTVAKIFLPESCTMENLANFLLVSLQQLELSKEGDAQTNEDRDAVIEPSPTFLSTEAIDMKFTKEQAEAIVATKAINPATKKPFELTDFDLPSDMSTNPPANPAPTPPPTVKVDDDKEIQMSVFAKAIAKKYVGDMQQNLQRRVQALVDSGRCDKDYADKHLVPQVSAVNLSFNNGEIAKSPVETLIEGLEALPPRRKTNAGLDFTLPNGSQVHDVPTGDDPEMTDDQMNALADELCSLL